MMVRAIPVASLRIVNVPIRRRLARLCRTIELDYRQLKGKLGLDHYESRRYAGFHHNSDLSHRPPPVDLDQRPLPTSRVTTSYELSPVPI